jgi:phage gpG-like protein
MAYGYTIEVDGLDEVREAIRRLGATPADTAAVRKDIGEEMIKRTHDRFNSGTAPDGSKWPESGRVKKSGGQTLLDHGALRDSVHYEPTPDGDLELYTEDIRARVHNEGLTITPKNGEFLVFAGEDGKLVFTREVHMPKREFLGFNDDDIEMVSEKFLDDLDRRFEGTR